MKVKTILFFSSLVITVIFLQAITSSWFFHLNNDVITYYARATYFLNHQGFSNLSGNEYQPGSLIFFILISPVLFISDTLKTYLISLFFANILLIFILSYLYKKFTDIRSVIVFMLIILFSGPIILFRFELFVMALVVASIYFWKKNEMRLSAFILGVSTLSKIFPVAILPYYLFLSFKNGGLKEAFSVLTAYVAGFFGFLVAFMLIFKASPAIVIESLRFLSSSPVHTESVWGTALTLGTKLTTGHFATGTGAFGIFGLDQKYILGPLGFYNYAFLVPLFLFYFWLFFKIKNAMTFDIKVCIVSVMIFLTFYKVINPQYLLWFTLLFPLFNINLFLEKGRYMIHLFLLLLIAFITQYIYPLNYTSLTTNFYVNGSYSYLFWFVMLRNLLLLWVLMRLILEIKESLAEEKVNG